MMLLLLFIPALLSAAEVSFNRDIRPILSEQCFHCHGPDNNNRKANLRLDLANPGINTAKILERVSHKNKGLRMPPAYAGRDALPAADIDKLKAWVAQGAKYESHWAFIPPARTPNATIDSLVRAKLKAAGLAPAPQADKATLLRRLSFDLTGLPPTPAEVDSFLKDVSAAAYEKQVDRLLASPRYAERMAWRWLEAGRYSDTNGYQSDGVRDMYRWRDWVIEAFQNNKPFDKFVVEQLAGDLLPNATLDQKMATAFHRNHRTSAEGGIVPEEFRVEYVADRAETTATVFLGLTMGCARCHDHKYDPITQRDFYSMFAFFNNLEEKGLVYNWGNDEPMMKAPTREQQAKLAELDAKVAAARRAVEKVEPRWQKQMAKWKMPADWLPHEGLAYENKLQGEASKFDGKRVVEEKGGTVVYDYLTPFTFSAWVKPDEKTGAIFSIAEDYAEGNGHGFYLRDGHIRLNVVFRWTDIGMRMETESKVETGKWQHLVATYDGSRYAKGVRIYIDGKPQKLNVLFDELNWPMNFKHPLKIGAGNGMNFKGEIRDLRIYKRELSQQEVTALAPQATPEKLRLAFLDQTKPKELIALRAAQEERDAFHKTIPTLMILREGPKRQAYLLKRGAYDAHGEVVEPATPSALPPMPKEATRDRLGLAQWIVSKDNPLLARVTVNRFWQMLFGIGIVKTVEDFGSQGEWPTHQELLDTLAVDFVTSGWDTKKLIRQIVTSETYMQSSKMSQDLLNKDPENRLFARAPRFRLAPEMIRDNALAVSGLLVEKVGGASVKPYQPAGLWQELAGGGGYPQDHGEALHRRSLYTFWKRTIAPPSMMNFDSPSREACTVRETRTNTPLQALNLMNDVTFLEAARKLAERIVKEGGEQPIDYAYQLVLNRKPTVKESQLMSAAKDRFAKRYRASPAEANALLDQGEAPMPRKLPRPELAAWTQVASLLLNLDETITRQ
jgi:cytochrome c553